MITGHQLAFHARCRQRGYTLDEVRACIVSEDGETITVDETHEAYPREAKPRPSPQPPAPASGPGTELKKLLKTWLRIEASPTCACTARARKMDEMEKLEPGWCAAHLDEIVGWLREEAAKRGLPFIGAAGKLLIKKAIRNALKNATQ